VSLSALESVLAVIPFWKSIAMAACLAFSMRCGASVPKNPAATLEYNLSLQTPRFVAVAPVNDMVPPNLCWNSSRTLRCTLLTDTHKKYCGPDFNARPDEMYMLPSPSKNPAAYSVVILGLYHIAALYTVPVNPRGTSQLCSGCGQNVPK